MLSLTLVVALVATARAVNVYRHPHYTTKTTPNIVYTKTLLHCTDLNNQTTCEEAEMVLDVWQPATNSSGPFPIVVTVHGGAFVSGDQVRQWSVLRC